jgi:N4-gp56 family major capsid protein
MSNAYTDTTSGSLGTSLVQTAYDRYVEFALRAVPLIRDVADKRPVQQAMPGSSVAFQIYTDLSAATSTLSESVDPDAVALGNTTTVSVALNEYGNASLATRKLELFSLSDVDPAIADIIAFNMADSLDTIVLNTLVGGPNVIAELTGGATSPVSTYAGTYTNGTTQKSIDSTSVIRSRDIRLAVAKLRANKAVPRQGEYYWCGIHPEVSHDLRAETGSGGWRDDHKFSETGSSEFWPGTIGTYEGAMFVESPRLFNAADGTGSGSASGTFGTSSYVNATGGVRVFRTLVAGKQALAEAVAEEPHVIFGPIVDKLMRFRPIGWYGVLGWARYRDASLVRIESSSSIHSA